MTNRLEMDTDLMSTACFWQNFNERVSAVFSEHSIVGQSFSHHSFCSPLRAPPSEIPRAFANWFINHAIIFFHLTDNKSRVYLSDSSFLKLFFQKIESFLIFGDDQST